MPERRLPSRVRVFEVGPRDGLQNESRILDVDARLELVARLVRAGLRDIEIGAFVHPRWVPQMAGTDELARRLPREDGVRYWALVPNLRGLERARAAGIGHVCLLASATDSHSVRNLNRPMAERERINAEVARAARDEGLAIRGYVSVAFGCPFEGDVPFDRVLAIGERFLENGVDEISLGDTVGFAGPADVARATRRAIAAFGAERVALHLHDTRGLGLANVIAGLDAGARIVDSSVGGIGGCPYAPGAAGNLATEDLVHLLERLEISSGVDLGRLVETSAFLERDCGIEPSSRYYRWASAQPAASGSD
ncbi:MAG: hydroxymethylglutaryl-CoA lyase [Acidobacteriota bacterium]